MGLLSMTDCTVADNRVQARHEYDKAERDPSPLARSAWFTKWGRELLDYANDAPNDEDINDAVCEAETRMGSEIERIRSEISDKIDEMRVALDELEKL